jgi:hypothetical protein
VNGLLLLWMLVGAAPAWAECPRYETDPSLLTALEPNATKGGLNNEEKDCLEKSYAAATEQTVKDKISRVLLVNAYAYSTKYWAELVKRHLDEVDRSDPDIAFLYAHYLFNTDKRNADEVIRWTDVGLERRDVWTGDVYVSRVYGLMKLRAVAANATWADAEDRRAKGEDVPNVEELRNNTKTYAREWVDFAKLAGKDSKESLALCLSAATRSIACGVEE